ncbi:MAG: gfo/Idh/MocA family oxidoreductase, partial [Planctomycetes bacterium]|nr:gfo/Idh/MocA family oxidoreductase [Planctomycetota bacterium]
MSARVSASHLSTASRRHFLATTSATVTGAMFAGNLAPARSVHAAGSDVMRIGLIGCGGRGSGAVVSALTVHPGAQLTA